MLVLLACGQGLHQRAWLLTHDGDVLTDAQQATLQTALTRRLAGEPMAYITGTKEFFGLPLQVDARVLDPLADTETLVGTVDQQCLGTGLRWLRGKLGTRMSALGNTKTLDNTDS